MTATTIDYEKELKRYAFTDGHGHPLENCTEYRALLEELRFLRDANSILKYNSERAHGEIKFLSSLLPGEQTA